MNVHHMLNCLKYYFHSHQSILYYCYLYSHSHSHFHCTNNCHFLSNYPTIHYLYPYLFFVNDRDVLVYSQVSCQKQYHHHYHNHHHGIHLSICGNQHLHFSTLLFFQILGVHLYHSIHPNQDHLPFFYDVYGYFPIYSNHLFDVYVLLILFFVYVFYDDLLYNQTENHHGY